MLPARPSLGSRRGGDCCGGSSCPVSHGDVVGISTHIVAKVIVAALVGSIAPFSVALAPWSVNGRLGLGNLLEMGSHEVRTEVAELRVDSAFPKVHGALEFGCPVVDAFDLAEALEGPSFFLRFGGCAAA